MTYPNLLDRFLTYVKVNTRSDEHSTTTPSTQSQVDFATDVLIPEMKRVDCDAINFENVQIQFTYSKVVLSTTLKLYIEIFKMILRVLKTTI